MILMSEIAGAIVIGCIVLAMGICIWCVLTNVDELVKNADAWEEGE